MLLFLYVVDGRYLVFDVYFLDDFVLNSIDFYGDRTRVFVIIGLNMGGKSCYIR